MPNLFGLISVRDDRIRFEFNQPLWIYESRDLHDGIDQSNLRKELCSDLDDLLPVFNSRPEHTRTNNILKPGPTSSTRDS